MNKICLRVHNRGIKGPVLYPKNLFLQEPNNATKPEPNNSRVPGSGVGVGVIAAPGGADPWNESDDDG